MGIKEQKGAEKRKETLSKKKQTSRKLAGRITRLQQHLKR
jgi:hypothetical protein